MFDDNDSLLMDYADGAGGWNRVKTKTPIHVVKASRSVRIRCQPDKMAKKIARRIRVRRLELLQNLHFAFRKISLPFTFTFTSNFQLVLMF